MISSQLGCIRNKPTRVFSALALVFAIGVIDVGFSAVVSSNAALGATKDAYFVKATGVGLHLALFGVTLVASSSSAQATSSGAASAKGTGEVTPAISSSQTATASGPSTSQNFPQACAQPSSPFPAPLASLISLGIACSTAGAQVSAGGTQRALGSGKLVTLRIGFTKTALPTLVTPGSALAASLTQILGPLPSLPTTGLPLGTVLVAASSATHANVTALLNLQIGAATSTVSSTPTSAAATSNVSQAKLNVLTGLGASGAPLLSITVLPGSAKSVINRTTGDVTSSETSAVATVTISPPVGTPQTITIGANGSETFLAGTPAATTVSVGGGASTSASGTGGATASPVTVHALTGVNGGATVVLGASKTAATSKKAPVASAASKVTKPSTSSPSASTTAAPVTTATAVHTGEFWASGASLAVLALAFFAGLLLLARRRIFSFAHLHGFHVPNADKGDSSLFSTLKKRLFKDGVNEK